MQRETVLELLGVETFYGKIKVLHGITMKVKQGQIATILGSNGAGKTTLLRTISGVVEAEYGQILFKDKRVEKLDPNKIVKSGISHVPQERLIFSELSVEENLKLGAFTTKKQSYDRESFYLFPCA